MNPNITASKRVIDPTIRALLLFLFPESMLCAELLGTDINELSLLDLLSLVIFVPVAIVYGAWVTAVLGAA